LGLLAKRSPTTILSPLATAFSLATDHDSHAQAMPPADGRKLGMVQAEVTAPGRQDRGWVAILDQ